MEEDLRKARDELEQRVAERTAELVQANEALRKEIAEHKRAEEERRRLETRMQHAQKLESLGILAGGIAHDFNNLLTAIITNAFLALQNLPPDSRAAMHVRLIQEAAQKSAELTNQMLAYSGRGKFLVRPVDLSEVVSEMGPLLAASVSKKAKLVYRLADNLPAIRVDVTQIRQVIMNLITNASDAIGDGCGTIRVTTDTVEVGSDHASGIHPGDALEPGPYVVLEVTDDGCGMDPKILPQIFEPFFTTKNAGRGLGLAALQGIVRGHRGGIEVHTEPGRGTTFRILFPCTAATDELPIGEPQSDQTWHGSGTLLVVDDEETVRISAKEVLEQFGFTVLCAQDGRQAVEVFREHADDIVAVLLDATMPEMNGVETLRAMRKIRPDVRVIIASGFPDQDTGTLMEEGIGGFIPKPYHPLSLVETFRQVLAPKGQSQPS